MYVYCIAAIRKSVLDVSSTPAVLSSALCPRIANADGGTAPKEREDSMEKKKEIRTFQQINKPNYP
jgi:uncharacterized tellurite resistance protein B-like protein